MKCCRNHLIFMVRLKEQNIVKIQGRQPNLCLYFETDESWHLADNLSVTSTWGKKGTLIKATAAQLCAWVAKLAASPRPSSHCGNSIVAEGRVPRARWCNDGRQITRSPPPLCRHSFPEQRWPWPWLHVKSYWDKGRKEGLIWWCFSACCALSHTHTSRDGGKLPLWPGPY